MVLTEMTKRARIGLPLRVQTRTFRPVFLEASRRCDPFSDREILIRCSRENDATRLFGSGKRIMVIIRWITPLRVSSSRGDPLYFLVVSSSSTETRTPLILSDSYDDPCSILFQSQSPVSSGWLMMETIPNLFFYYYLVNSETVSVWIWKLTIRDLTHLILSQLHTRGGRSFDSFTFAHGFPPL